MSYQALYRKYRPADFTDVKGQEHIVTTLNNQIHGNRVGHAYLFCGTRGTGKTTVAKIFARAVNCQNPGPAGPCGECDMCKAIALGNSMNVVEIDAASNNRVDDIRQVIDEVQYSPAEGKYKVYIIDEVHMLSTSAFNALLKTLEEPPAYLIFILATTEAHKIPLTIRSRCQRYDFKRISVETIADRLRELLEREQIEAEDRALQYIARQADGALRDGLSLLEQCISFYFGQKLTYENVLKVLGAVDHSVYHELMEALVSNQVDTSVQVIARVVEQGKDLTQFVSEFVWYLRNLLVVKTAEDAMTLIDVSEENLLEMKKYAEQIEPEMLFRYIRVLSELANEMKYSTNKRVVLEVAIIRLCRPEMEKDYDSVINRLHNLEEMISSGAVMPAQEESWAPEEKKEETKKRVIRQEAVPEDVRQAVAAWRQVMQKLGPVTRAMLDEVRLSISDAGALILAFAKETPVEYFKEEKNVEELSTVTGEITGKEIKMEFRYVQSQRDYQTLPELRSLISDKVMIEMED